MGGLSVSCASMKELSVIAVFQSPYYSYYLTFFFFSLYLVSSAVFRIIILRFFQRSHCPGFDVRQPRQYLGHATNNVSVNLWCKAR